MSKQKRAEAFDRKTKNAQRDRRKTAIRAALKSEDFETFRTPDGDFIARKDGLYSSAGQSKSRETRHNLKKGRRRFVNTTLHTATLMPDEDVEFFDDMTTRHIVAAGNKFGNRRWTFHCHAEGGNPLPKHLTFEELIRQAEEKHARAEATPRRPRVGDRLDPSLRSRAMALLP